MVLWAAILPGDSLAAARNASAFLDQKRAQHFWDTWNFAPRAYGRLFSYPEIRPPWDIYLLYPGETEWSDPAPPPVSWLRRHEFETGIPYSRERLEKELDDLLGQF